MGDLDLGEARQATQKDKGEETSETQTSQKADARDRIYYPGDTERIKPLMRKLIGNIVLDQKEIWASPFRMDRQQAKWWLGFAVATGALMVTDTKASNIFENSSGQIAWGKNISRLGASYTLLPLIVGFYGYGVSRDNPKAREVGVLGTETLADSLIVVQALKAIAGRNRPDAQSDRSEFLEGGTSFPSGHAIASWSLASLIAHEYQRPKIVPVIAYGLAALASSARFTAQKHYASDIVAGGAMGWFMGRYVYQTHVNHAIHSHTWLKPQIVPVFQPAGGALGPSRPTGSGIESRSP